MGKKKIDLDADFEADRKRIEEQVQEEFDLGAVLRGRPLRTKKVVAFTDENLGEELGGAQTEEFVGDFGVPQTRLRTWGVMGKIAELLAGETKDEPAAEKAKRTKQINALKKEAVTLRGRLEESALEIELHSIPSRIRDGAYRAAREALGINGKVSDDDPRSSDLKKEVDAQLLVRTVGSIKNNATGQTNKGVSIENARAMRGYLPDSEWEKVVQALADLLYETVIAQNALEDPDF